MLDLIQILLIIGVLWLLLSQKSTAPFGKLFAKQRKLILDSCALIDGRIIELVSTRFINDELVIPQFILNELQLLADGNDSHKRERARFGLDIAHQLQDSAPNKVTIDRTVFTQQVPTDDKLVLLARKLDAHLYTTDYNLGKVAAVEGVHVLNVNELAQGLRPIALPGETLSIKVIQKGSNRDQGVGYLEDGTMIVIDGGARYIGKVMPVTVMRMHQTVAGKMVFGQVREQQTAKPKPQKANLSSRASTEANPADAPQPSGVASRLSPRSSRLSGSLQRLAHRRKRPLV